MVFDSGSATIRVDQIDTLDQMLETLVPYRENYAFAVEGHTDDTPVVDGPYASNWELSTGRANAVRSRLETVGVTEERIRVEGYAATVPLEELELEGLSEEERLARHRRVVVRIY
jgi:chemotaxis protein MotB